MKINQWSKIKLRNKQQLVALVKDVLIVQLVVLALVININNQNQNLKFNKLKFRVK
jgi:hypothetical protein